MIEDNFTARGLKEAKEELDIMKLSDEERREYEEYHENLRYRASIFESSYKVGEMKGREEGAKEKAIEMAKTLKENGINPDIIAKSSGLSLEEIEKL